MGIFNRKKSNHNWLLKHDNLYRDAYKEMLSNLQATEGSRNNIDPLQTPTTSTARTVRKNNFTTYDNIVSEIKDKYVCYADYGVSLVGSTIDLRAAIIGGEGLSVVAEKKETQSFIDIFFDDNGMKDGVFIELCEEAEKEGKLLLVIKALKDGDRKKILIKHIPYTDTKYKVEKDDFNRPYRVVWHPDDGDEIVYQKEDFVYLHFGGNSGDINNTPPRVGKVLTQIENYERCIYDIREANHLFGYPTPVFETSGNTAQNLAQWIAGKINQFAWTIGKAIAVPGKVKYLMPDVNAVEVLRGEMALNMMLIAANMGIPIHLLNWVELMSNRATAETMSEIPELTTKKDRLKWKAGIRDLIRKAMVKAVDFGVSNAINDPDGFEIEIPQLTAEKLKEIIDVWLVLNQADKISDYTLLNKTPGVDPAQEARLLKKQKKEREKEKPQELRDFEKKLNRIDPEKEEEPENGE